ncbi:MAG: type I methionyl aminopeptidase [Clostridiales bacterium]|jgi:methionyl aminopeptidase|nr:type I methionyl aminopeptidase [Clostridiales bacterium]
MITIKSPAELEIMRDAGKITALAREEGSLMVKEGVTTRQIDKKIREVIARHNATPSFLGYNGFPAAACVSVNEEVIHGIPSNRVLNAGDIVKIDVGAIYKGYQGDCAATIPVGNVAPETEKLIQVTKESFFKALEKAVTSNRIGDIGNAVEEYATRFGFSVVRDFVGHGIGRQMHEEPSIPNFGRPGHGVLLREGMTLAIEPMINQGTWKVRVLNDGWTVVTLDGKLSAHYENTVAITSNGPEILTVPA